MIDHFLKLLCSIVSVLAVTACERVDPEAASVRRAESISISSALIDPASLHGREVVIDAYLIRHTDGPWLADDPDNALDTALSIELAPNFRAFNAEGREIYIPMFDDIPYGKAKGVFVIGNYNVRGFIVEDHPHLLLKAFVEHR